MMSWEKKYPILKDYPNMLDEEDLKRYNLLMESVLDELRLKYKLSHNDSVLVAKDILYKKYLQVQK